MTLAELRALCELATQQPTTFNLLDLADASRTWLPALIEVAEALTRIGKIAHGDTSDDFEDDTQAVGEIERLVNAALARLDEMQG